MSCEKLNEPWIAACREQREKRLLHKCELTQLQHSGNAGPDAVLRLRVCELWLVDEASNEEELLLCAPEAR
eukprot:6172619-Pleurochrysis_carterae.AAC.1